VKSEIQGMIVLNSIISDVYDFSSQHSPSDGLIFCEAATDGIVHDHRPQCRRKQIYRPILCLVVQGAKELILGERRVVMRAGQSMIVSHDLPVTTQILEASPSRPYLSVVIELDMALVRSLYDEVSDALPPTTPAHSIDVGEADEGLVSAMRRLLALHANPLNARVLEPLIRREIHFRLLMADHGGMLRELLRIDSHAGRIAKRSDAFRTGFASRWLFPNWPTWRP
jgi:hypothetical protein